MLSHRKIKASSNLVQKESEIIKNHIRMTSILAHTFFYLLFVLIGILLDFLFIANLEELIDTGKYLKEYLGVVFCQKFTIMIIWKTNLKNLLAHITVIISKCSLFLILFFTNFNFSAIRKR